MSELNEKKCVPCEGGVRPLNAEKIKEHLATIHQWQITSDNKKLFKEFKFKNFYHTMAFVNAIAFMANQENHHPDLEIGFNYCRVYYTTHAVNGLTENDFICCAKIDGLEM